MIRKRNLNKLIHNGIILISMLFLVACSDSGDNASKLSPFPEMPKDKSTLVQLTGKVDFWLFEGDAGCYGTLTDGLNKVEVYSEAIICEKVTVSEGSVITVDIIYDSQISDIVSDGEKPSYTIIAFR